MREYLPVGSVVLLNGRDDLPILVAGYLPQQGQRISDYFGVPYPLGLLTPLDSICFNRDDIVQVLHRGYSDAKCHQLLAGLEQMEQDMVSTVLKSGEGEQNG